MAAEISFLKDRPTLEQLVGVQDKFNLRLPIYVEKDWYVVQALSAITSVDPGPFTLIFQGGTALSRAHRLIDRMSEDVDIKITSKEKQGRAAYRRLREDVTKALHAAGFEFDPENEQNLKSMYKSQYNLFQLPYAPVAEGDDTGLRPEIQIELSAWPARLAPIERPVSSFVAEAHSQKPEISGIFCAHPDETAAEKFVALTRRAGAEIAGLAKGRDLTLVRHIYDLHLIRTHVDQDQVASLALEIMKEDAATRGARFPAYRQDPLGESLRAVEGIGADKQFAEEYDAFLRRMVYGVAPGFDEAFGSLSALSDRIRSKK